MLLLLTSQKPAFLSADLQRDRPAISLGAIGIPKACFVWSWMKSDDVGFRCVRPDHVGECQESTRPQEAMYLRNGAQRFQPVEHSLSNHGIVSIRAIVEAFEGTHVRRDPAPRLQLFTQHRARLNRGHLPTAPDHSSGGPASAGSDLEDRARIGLVDLAEEKVGGYLAPRMQVTDSQDCHHFVVGGSPRPQRRLQSRLHTATWFSIQVGGAQPSIW